MNKFRDLYKESVDKLPQFHMDAQKVQDELHHHKMQRKRRNHIIVRGCTAAAVFLLCGVGTVAAHTYRNSIIQINESGYTVTGGQEPRDISRTDGGVSVAEASADEIAAKVGESQTVQYNSIEEFLQESDVVVAIPDKTLFNTKFELENVEVFEEGRNVFIGLLGENQSFFLTQFDNREVLSYSSGTTYGGQTENERSFTNSQGLSYIVFDTVDETGRIESTHAVISVNGWDLSVTFRGFEEKIVEAVLEALDLTVYF